MVVTFGNKMFGVIQYRNSIYVVDMDTHEHGRCQVRESDEFVFKCSGHSIYAIDGVSGLLKFMNENRNTPDLFSCRVKQICEFVISRG